jgi:mono/diheme cytochrome c family protein
MYAQQDSWPGLPAENKVAHAAAIGVALAALLGALYLFALEWRRILDMGPVDLYLTGAPPEQGGWQGEDLRVASGRMVNLHVESLAGTHSFALAHTDVRSSRALAPGDHETVTFVAPEPGRYVLYCTTWCSPNHWRMRTVLEVSDPDDAEAPVTYPQTSQRYDFSVADLGLDEPHPAASWPASPPSAAEGVALWQAAAPDESPSSLLSSLGWPVITPEAVYARLSGGQLPGLESAQGLSEEQRWALVAHMWRQSTTPEALASGAEMFEQNCVDCHGFSGQGDGIASVFSEGVEPDLSDAKTAAGASPALYYSKMARGGMGTGMPNWGVVMSEDQLWALTDYLYSFLFDYSADEE